MIGKWNSEDIALSFGGITFNYDIQIIFLSEL